MTEATVRVGFALSAARGVYRPCAIGWQFMAPVNPLTGEIVEPTPSGWRPMLNPPPHDSDEIQRYLANRAALARKRQAKRTRERSGLRQVSEVSASLDDTGRQVGTGAPGTPASERGSSHA